MEDIWSHVALFIPKGSWKSFIFTCKLFASFNSSEQVKKRANHLMTWIKLNPDLPWYINDSIYGNYELPKYYDIEAIKAIDTWDWQHVGSHPSIRREDIFNNLDLPWEGLIKNPNLSLRDLEELKVNFGDEIFSHPDMPLGELLELSFIHWSHLSSHKDITIDFVLANIDKPFDWFNLTMNKSIKMQDILDHPNLPWSNLEMRDDYTSHEYLKIRKGSIYDLGKVYIEDVLAEPDVPWVFHNLQHCDFTLLDIKKVSWASSITIEDLLKIDGWDWDVINQSTRIPLSEILKHPNLPWNFVRLRTLDHISDIDILEHPELFKNISMLAFESSSVYNYLDKEPCYEDLKWLKFW